MENAKKIIHKKSQKHYLTVEQCKKRLATLWFIVSGCLFLLFVGQTLGDHYHNYTEEAWGWFLPAIMPTLSLIIGVLVIEARHREKNTKKADTFLYRLSFWLSSVYLLSLTLTILLQPVMTLSPIKLMNRSSFWLGPVQGLVAASLGAFFVKKESN